MIKPIYFASRRASDLEFLDPWDFTEVGCVAANLGYPSRGKVVDGGGGGWTTSDCTDRKKSTINHFIYKLSYQAI